MRFVSSILWRKVLTICNCRKINKFVIRHRKIFVFFLFLPLRNQLSDMELIVITVVVSFRDLFKGGYTSRRVKKSEFQIHSKGSKLSGFFTYTRVSRG